MSYFNRGIGFRHTKNVHLTHKNENMKKVKNEGALNTHFFFLFFLGDKMHLNTQFVFFSLFLDLCSFNTQNLFYNFMKKCYFNTQLYNLIKKCSINNLFWVTIRYNSSSWERYRLLVTYVDY